MTKELYYSSINELNELYINKKTSPTEVTKVFLERIKKHDSDLNSFINVRKNERYRCLINTNSSRYCSKH